LATGGFAYYGTGLPLFYAAASAAAS